MRRISSPECICRISHHQFNTSIITFGVSVLLIRVLCKISPRTLLTVWASRKTCAGSSSSSFQALKRVFWQNETWWVFNINFSQESFHVYAKKNLLAMVASQNEEREKEREMKEFNAHTELAVANSRQKADSGMKCSFFLPALANPWKWDDDGDDTETHRDMLERAWRTDRQLDNASPVECVNDVWRERRQHREREFSHISRLCRNGNARID